MYVDSNKVSIQVRRVKLGQQLKMTCWVGNEIFTFNMSHRILIEHVELL